MRCRRIQFLLALLSDLADLIQLIMLQDFNHHVGNMMVYLLQELERIMILVLRCSIFQFEMQNYLILFSIAV